jgi:protein ImuB
MIPSCDDLADPIPDVSERDVLARLPRFVDRSRIAPAGVASPARDAAAGRALFACLYASSAPEGALAALARTFSPRVQIEGTALVTIDVGGLRRLLGGPDAIAAELARVAAACGIDARVAVAATRTAALVTARARTGVTVIAPGAEAASLADVPLDVLDSVVEFHPGPAANQEKSIRATLATVRRWGLCTLGELGSLPPADLFERIGASAPALQRLARGEDAAPLVPARDRMPFEATFDLEWPVDRLEPLSFVLGRLLDPLCARLEREDCGATTVEVVLQLASRDTCTRTLSLPVPIRDPRVLRTLVLIDLESHMTAADRPVRGARLEQGIDRVTVRLGAVRGRVVQFSLLQSAAPRPEQLSTLLARLAALMGEERVGAAVLVDTHRPGAFAMRPFSPDRPAGPSGRTTTGTMMVRRLRVPVAVRVAVERGRPVRVAVARAGLRSGRVAVAAGPWRASGDWWEARTWWTRDEWDVALEDGTLYRLYRDRGADRWYVEGTVD